MPLYNNNATFRNVIECRVLSGIKSDTGIVGNAEILVDNGAAHMCSALTTWDATCWCV